jgi:hypothetical protein
MAKAKKMALKVLDGSGKVRDMTPAEEANFLDGRSAVADPKANLAPLTRKQFFKVSAKRQIITEQEALDAISKKAIPAPIDKFIATLPANQQFDARCEVLAADTFSITHPLVEGVRSFNAMTDDFLIQMWKDGALL